MTEALSLINLLGFKASDRLLRDLLELLIEVLALIYKKCDHLAYLFTCIIQNLLVGEFNEK